MVTGGKYGENNPFGKSEYRSDEDPPVRGGSDLPRRERTAESPFCAETGGDVRRIPSDGAEGASETRGGRVSPGVRDKRISDGPEQLDQLGSGEGDRNSERRRMQCSVFPSVCCGILAGLGGDSGTFGESFRAVHLSSGDAGECGDDHPELQSGRSDLVFSGSEIRGDDPDSPGIWTSDCGGRVCDRERELRPLELCRRPLPDHESDSEGGTPPSADSEHELSSGSLLGDSGWIPAVLRGEQFSVGTVYFCEWRSGFGDAAGEPAPELRTLVRCGADDGKLLLVLGLPERSLRCEKQMPGFRWRAGSVFGHEVYGMRGPAEDEGGGSDSGGELFPSDGVSVRRAGQCDGY